MNATAKDLMDSFTFPTRHDLEQGSDEWLRLRMGHCCSSEAPAMMGDSKHTSRPELLKLKSTGMEKEYSRWTLRLFEEGHRTEEQARAVINQMTGYGFQPAVYTIEINGIPMLASLDGIAFMEDETVIFEHKLWNQSLIAQIQAGELEPAYYWQLEQQLLVTGADKVLFVCSDGTDQNLEAMWYSSRPERQTLLLAGWAQFQEDVKGYEYVEPEVVRETVSMEQLPALYVQVEGRVVSSNLAAFETAADRALDAINMTLNNDNDFAQADRDAKSCREAVERIALIKQQTLSQAATIEEVIHTLDRISERFRSRALHLEKESKARKEAIRVEILKAARIELEAHVFRIDQRLEANLMPPIDVVRFAAAIKGKRSLDGCKNALDAEVARAKIEASEIGDRIAANIKLLSGEAHDWKFLFPDLRLVCTKPAEDFAALLHKRISDHNEAEAARKAREEAAEKARQAEVVVSPPQFEPSPGMSYPQRHQASRSASSSLSEEVVIEECAEPLDDAAKARIREDIYEAIHALGVGVRPATQVAIALVEGRIPHVTVSTANL